MKQKTVDYLSENKYNIGKILLPHFPIIQETTKTGCVCRSEVEGSDLGFLGRRHHGPAVASLRPVRSTLTHSPALLKSVSASPHQHLIKVDIIPCLHGAKLPLNLDYDQDNFNPDIRWIAILQ